MYRLARRSHGQHHVYVGVPLGVQASPPIAQAAPRPRWRAAVHTGARGNVVMWRDGRWVQQSACRRGGVRCPPEEGGARGRGFVGLARCKVAAAHNVCMGGGQFDCVCAPARMMHPYAGPQHAQTSRRNHVKSRRRIVCCTALVCCTVVCCTRTSLRRAWLGHAVRVALPCIHGWRRCCA